MSASHCRSCGAPIIWAETVNGRRMPLDEDPDPDGKFVLDETREPPLATFAPTDPGERFQSHFATCPDSDKHRRRP